MHWLVHVIHYFPFLALPVVAGFIQVGWHLKRRKAKAQFVYWGLAAALLGLCVCWWVFRADMNGTRWMRDYLGVEPLHGESS